MKKGYHLFFALLFYCCSFSANAQAVTYEKVTATVAAGATSVDVADESEFSAGDRVLLIQMQGADYDGTNGTLDGINNAGLFEELIVASTAAGQVSFTSPTANAYTAAGNVQLIRAFSSTTDYTLNAAVDVTDWDPATGTGGVYFMHIDGILTLNTTINADGAGFGGGDIRPERNPISGAPCSNSNIGFADFTTDDATASTYSGRKGYGVVLESDYATQDAGNLPIVNAGGAGGYNSAGGGGGGGFADGGRGGRKNTTTSEFCCFFSPGGCNSNNANGRAGNGLDPSSFTGVRAFMGGGGGSGNTASTNAYFNVTASRGAAGGGIVIITADELVANGQTISANGANAAFSNKGGGGGGGGGTIILNINTYDNSGGALNASASGGFGGSAQSAGGSAPNDREGECGGGGGGYVWFSASVLPAVNTAVEGGLDGRNRTDFATFGRTRGYGNGFSDPGENGATGVNFSFPAVPTPLPVELLSFTAERENGDVKLTWTTAKEVNTADFELQRLGSNESSKTYTGVATIPAAAQKGLGATYAHFDSDLPDARTLYYRLKTRDYDGTESYSAIVQVTFDEIDEVKITLTPNPVSANKALNIGLQSSSDGTAQIEVFDLAGRRHYVTQQQTIAGSQTLSITTDDFTTGVYLLRVTNNGAQSTSRFQVVPATR